MVKMDPNHCNNNFTGAQERVIKKSYLQRFMDYITGSVKIKYIYVHPDISIEQGNQTLDILSYKEQSGRAKLDIKLPTGSKFKYFSKNQTGTEFQAELVNLNGNKNAVQCKVRTEKKKRQTNENFVTQGHTQGIDKNIQDEFYHFVDQDEVSLQTLFYEGEEVRLRSQSTKELYIYGKACLLTTLKFENGNVMRRKKTCTLFTFKGEMNSASAYLQRVDEIEDLSNDSNVLAFTETERYLYIEILHSDSKEVVYLLAKELQNHSKVTQISRLKNLLRYLETKNQALRNQSQCSNTNYRDSSTRNEKSSIKRLKEINKISQNKVLDAHQERYYSNSKFHIKDNKDTTFSHDEWQRSVEKKQDVDNTTTNRGRRNNNKLNEQWFVRSKMKNARVKTNTKTSSGYLKIYLQSWENEIGDLVNEYFDENIIRQAVYGSFRHDFDRRCKTSFDRPSVPWPSMHPLLPYKLRYLDVDDETPNLHRNQKQYNEFVSEFKTESLESLTSDSGTDQYESCPSECSTDRDLDQHCTDENNTDNNQFDG